MPVSWQQWRLEIKRCSKGAGQLKKHVDTVYCVIDRNSHHTTYISIPIIIHNISRSSIVQGLIASVSMRLGLSIELAQGGTASK